MKLADLFIKLGLKSGEYTRGIDQAQKKTNTFKDGLKKIGGIIAGAFAVSAIKNFAQEAMRLYNIQAQAENQLLVALKGRRDAQQDLIKQAGELQSVTLYGDEETIRAQALIAAFVKEEQQIKAIIPLVQDLATAKGMQLAAAADLVSKTLGSSTNALSRYGIAVEGAVGSSERLQSLVQGLSIAFEGQAKAAAQVGTGPLTQLANKWGDVKEEIGETLVKSKDFQKTIGQLNQELDRVPGFLDGIITGLRGIKTAMDVLSGKKLIDVVIGLFKSKEDLSDQTKEVKQHLDQESAAYRNQIALQQDLAYTEATRSKTIGELKAEVEALKASIDDYGISQSGEIQRTLREIEAKEKLIKTLTTLKTKREDTSYFTSMTGQAGTPKISDTMAPMPSGLGDMTGFLAKNAEMTKKYTAEMLADWNNFTTGLGHLVNDGIINFIDEFAYSLGQLASGNINLKGFFNNILSQLSQFLGQIGKLMIAFGVAQLAFGESLKNIFNPANAPILIAAGAGLVAISGAIGGMASKAVGGGGGAAGSVSGGINIKTVDKYDKDLVARVSGRDLEFVLQKRSLYKNRS